MGLWGYSTPSHCTALYSQPVPRLKKADLSHHAQMSMHTSRAKMAASRMNISALIQNKFVAEIVTCLIR